MLAEGIMKHVIFILFSLLCMSAKTHTFSFPDQCGFLTDDGNKFPASDKEFFEKLQELQCPELSYQTWGRYGKNVEERRFIVYWEWRGGIGNSSVGVCRAAKYSITTIEDPTKAPTIFYTDHECRFEDPHPHTSGHFEENRKK